jgi:hypothetical protein
VSPLVVLAGGLAVAVGDPLARMRIWSATLDLVGVALAAVARVECKQRDACASLLWLRAASLPHLHGAVTEST